MDTHHLSPGSWAKPMRGSLGFLLAALLLFTACQSAENQSVNSLRDPGTGIHHRPIATQSAAAQAAFDEGLVWLYAFNHDEAIRCFERAAAGDPQSPMPYWGIAYAHGPHINNPAMSPERSRLAYAALTEAQARVAQGSNPERELVDALSARYAATPPQDRGPLDQAYAARMTALAERYPQDPDIVTLAAEALMDLHPWDLWTKDFQPKTDTLRIVALLEQAIALDPGHPGAHHLYIHAIEASSQPERALPSADRLRDLVPASGHLLHMPAHIDLRVGNYAAAAEANEVAMRADQSREGRYPKDGFYRLYMAHNPHFLSFVAMMQGRSSRALSAAQQLVAAMPEAFVKASPGLADAFLPIVPHVLVRFGRFEEILALPPYAPELIGANITRHYARGVAWAARGEVDAASQELRSLHALYVTLDERTIGNNPAKLVLRIPALVLEGEILFRAGQRQDGLAKLREAVAIEDQLAYDEPPDWMMPVRHPLGAALLVAGEFAEAARCFEEDLRRFPSNGWALFGLMQAERGLGRDADAERTGARLEAAWSSADVALTSPCFCQATTP